MTSGAHTLSWHSLISPPPPPLLPIHSNEWSWAESKGLAVYDPSRRYFSINRAFAPGASRIGAIVWTGDISPSWNDLVSTPGMVLSWSLAGAPYVTCDIGGFSGETNALLLSRWYGVGVFMPVMRVHSTNSATPHFPFPELWGQEASAAMRTLLELRYALVPHLYSLGHETFLTGLPIARPMIMEFADASTASLTSQWMIGDAILVAPVISDSNATSAVLPVLPSGSVWYPLQPTGGETYTGGQTVSLPDVPLDTVPAFVRSGGIVLFAPLIQYTDALPGGPLTVTVFAGADGNFTLYEDDGETRGYETGAVATTFFSWDDSTRCISWTRGGVAGAGGAQSFVQLQVRAFFTDHTSGSAPVQDIGNSGTACPK